MNTERSRQIQEDLEDAFRGLDEQRETVESNLNEEKALDLELLTQVWIRERSIEEILPYESDLMERIIERVQEQVEFLEINSEDSLINEKTMKLVLIIVETELEKVRYLLKSYIRTRLAKLDKFGIYIQREEHEVAKLSPVEIEYMRRHLEILSELLNEQYLNIMPPNLQSLADPEMITAPSLNHPVFVMCKQDCEVILDESKVGADPDATLEMRVGEVFVIKYSLVQDALANDYLVVI